MKRTIRASNSPADDITVEMKSMFADSPSASLKILRHGVAEHAFSLYELGELCEAIGDMKFMIQSEQGGAS